MSTLGLEAGELMAAAGRPLDPWQQFSVDAVLGLRADDKFAARTGVIVLPRQNGKGVVDEAVELAEVQLLDFPVVLHTAHHAKTAKNAFDKMRGLIEGCGWLRRRLAGDRSGGIRTANGEWGFTFKTGQRLIYGTRTSGAGRGLTIDGLTLDEGQELSDDELEALIPTTAASPNPLVLWSGSAPKQHQEVFARMIVAGRSGAPGLCYLEWSVDGSVAVDLDDPTLLAVANPGLGYRLDLERIRDERAMLSDEGYGRERLGIISVTGGNALAAGWKTLQDDTSSPSDTPTYALAVADDRSWACVAAAGVNSSGLLHVECGAYHSGTGWVVDWLAELRSRKRIRVVLRPSSQAGSLISELDARKVPVVTVSGQDYAAACGDFYDSVTDRRDVRHLGQPALDVAVAQAQTRRNADAFTWDQRNPAVDISPLEAVTLAAWGHRFKQAKSGRFVAF